MVRNLKFERLACVMCRFYYALLDIIRYKLAIALALLALCLYNKHLLFGGL